MRLGKSFFFFFLILVNPNIGYWGRLQDLVLCWWGSGGGEADGGGRRFWREKGDALFIGDQETEDIED